MIFDAKQISELLKSDDQHFRRIAYKSVIDEFNTHSSLFFNLLLEDYDCEHIIDYAFQRFPSLNAGFDKTSPLDQNKEYRYFGRYFTDHKIFLNKLGEYISQENNKKLQEKLIARLNMTFKGVREDLTALYPQYQKKHTQEDVSARQLMIFITGKCTLNCSYCFANNLQPKDMQLSEFEEILQWASANNITKISLCGGEPTFHVDFDKILFLIREYRFTTYFASNFTVDCTSLENFSKEVIDKIYIHITGQTLKSRQLKKMFLDNVMYSNEKGIPLTLRANISDINPEIDEWFNILYETGTNALNVALTFPNRTNNKFIGKDSFEEYSSMLSHLITRSDEAGITLSFAKPVPLCIFEEQTQHYLLSKMNFRPTCNVHYQNYTNNICITPEMIFHPCLGITTSSLKFHKYISWNEVEIFSKNVIKPLLNKPLFPICADCFLFDRKLCQGGCLSYKTMI